jgi:hypothetical protein
MEKSIRIEMAIQHGPMRFFCRKNDFSKKEESREIPLSYSEQNIQKERGDADILSKCLTPEVRCFPMFTQFHFIGEETIRLRVTKTLAHIHFCTEERNGI